MNKILFSRHVRINPRLLEFLSNDSPPTKPRTEEQVSATITTNRDELQDKMGDNPFLLCPYAKFECHKSCYASESQGCSLYHFYRGVKR